MKILLACVLCGLMLMAGCEAPRQVDPALTTSGIVDIGFESSETLEYTFQSREAHDNFFNGIIASHLVPALPVGTEVSFPFVYFFVVGNSIQIHSQNDVVNESLRVADRNKDEHITETEALNFFRAQSGRRGG